MSIMPDVYNELEHQLRDHVLACRTAWHIVHDGKLYIEYEADEERWRVHSYNPDITTRGAELRVVVEAHIDAYRRHVGLHTLRSRS